MQTDPKRGLGQNPKGGLGGWGAEPPQPPVGVLPRPPLYIRMHEYFSCLIMHLIMILNNTFSQDSSAYSMLFFLLRGEGAIGCFLGMEPQRFDIKILVRTLRIN